MTRKWLAKINVADTGKKPKWVKIGAERQIDGRYNLIASNGDEMPSLRFSTLTGCFDAIHDMWGGSIWNLTIL